LKISHDCDTEAVEIASTNQVPNAMMEVYAASKKLATSELDIPEKSHQHTQWKLARLAACATPIRPMAYAGQTGDTGKTSGQSRSGRGYNSRTTNVPESLNDFSRPWNKTPQKHNQQGRRTLHKT
jgi:hypothetical protein